jgi:phosphatidylinositol glycan class C protein
MVILAVSLFPVDSTQVYMPSTSLIVCAIVIALVNLVGPWMLWFSWTWKTRRGGGWEVAKVKLRKSKRE